MKTITVKCGICAITLLTDSGLQLTDDMVSMYQASTSCDTDGNINIQVTIND